MRPLGKITVNGVEYDSPEAMPSGIRAEYERAIAALKDEDGDGVPDILQSAPEAKVLVKQKLVVNGKEYASRDALPAEMRQVLDQVLGPNGGSSAGHAPLQIHRKVRSRADALGAEQPVAKSYPWSLILALLAAVALLGSLWLTGVTPASLLRRLR
jgi:hypothetical protein